MSKLYGFVQKHFNLVAIILFAFISFVIILPLITFMKGLVPFSLFDFQFHLNTLQESFFNLQQGSLSEILPPITTQSFGSFGYPLSLVYPIFTCIPEVFIHVLVGNVWYAYIIFVTLCLFLMMISMLLCTTGIGFSHFSVLVSSIIYAFCPFALFNFLGGVNDINQGMVLIFLPIVFYGMYEITVGERKKWWILSFGMFLIVMTHLLSVVITSLFLISLLGMIFLANDSFQEKMYRIIDFIYAAGTTILLSAFFIFPLFQIINFTGTNQQASEIQSNNWPLDIYSFKWNDFLFSSSQMTEGLTLLYLFGLVVIIVMFVKLPRVYKYLTFVLLFFSFLCTNLFPWSNLQQVFGFIQKPARFSCIPEFLIALLFGVALGIICQKSSKVKYSKMALILAIIVAGTATSAIAFASFHPNKNHPTMTTKQVNADKTGLITENKLTRIAGQGLTLDYISEDSIPLIGKLAGHSVSEINSTLVGLTQQKWYTEYDSIFYQVDSAKSESRIQLPNLYFPGFHVKVNGKEVPIKIGKEKQIEITIANGKSDIKVYYKKPPLRIAAVWISIISWVLLLGSLTYEWIKKLHGKTKL